MDKIWIKTLDRLDALEERVGRIENLCRQEPLPLSVPELEPKSEPGPEPEQESKQ